MAKMASTYEEELMRDFTLFKQGCKYERDQIVSLLKQKFISKRDAGEIANIGLIELINLISKNQGTK